MQKDVLKAELFYKGSWQKSTTQLEVRSPYNGQLVGTLATLDSDELASSIDFLHEKGIPLSSHRRSEILINVAHRLSEERRSLATMISREAGIPLKWSLHEIDRARQVVQFASAEPKRLEGNTYPMDVSEREFDRVCMTFFEPIGIVSCITPFNHPLNQIVHKMAPAIAAGNKIVIKPSEKTPLTCALFCKILLDCGFPKENLVFAMGNINELSAVLCKHKHIGMVSFTGGTDVGSEILKQTGVRKTLMELGGNSPFIILEDTDLERTADLVLNGAFGNNGQRCTAINRIIIQTSIADRFVQLLKDRVEKLHVGDPLDEKTDVGPVISKESANRIERLILNAKENGAEVVFGGKREGNIIFPTILDHVHPELEIAQKENFGPTAPIIRIESLEEAVEVANSTPYGLSSAICTRDIESIRYAMKTLKNGMVIVNEVPGFRVESIPFGGIKQSGIGREGVKYATREMSQLKTVIL